MDEIIKNNLQFKYRGIPTRIDLVQYTNAMRLVFVLTDYPMPSGATARIYVKKPSGKEVYNVAAINGDTVTVGTTTQMTAEAGTNNAQLQIVKGSIVAASFVFCLNVQPNIAEATAIESSNEYGVLDGLIADANNLIDQARAALGGITPINNLTSTDASKPLAAPMGKLLDDKISSLNADLDVRTYWLKEPIMVGSDTYDGGWYKVLEQKMPGYENTNIMFSVISTYTYEPFHKGSGILSIQIRSNLGNIRINDFTWLVRSGFSVGNFFIVIENNKWSLFAKVGNIHNYYLFNTISGCSINSNNYNSMFKYKAMNQSPEETVPTPAQVSSDLIQ